MTSFLLLQSLILYLVPLASATCYYPDGTIETNNEYQPCVATVGTFSMCCATNRAQFPDQCLPNGLCHNPCATSGFCGDSTGGQYWRESCTDPTWSSPYCLTNVCTNKASGGSPNNTAAVSLCVADGTWCCGGDLNSTACCASNVVRVAIAATVGVSSTSMSTRSSTGTSTSTSATISTSSTNNPATTSTGTSASPSATPPASSSNNGEIRLGVGLGVGATCVLIAAAIVAYLVLRKRRREQEHYDPVQSANTQEYFRPIVLPKAELDTRVHERVELGSGNHQTPYSGNVVYHEVHA